MCFTLRNFVRDGFGGASETCEQPLLLLLSQRLSLSGLPLLSHRQNVLLLFLMSASYVLTNHHGKDVTIRPQRYI